MSEGGCAECDGEGAMDYLDVWTFARKGFKGVPKIEAGCPCPNCHEDEARKFLSDKTSKHGEPFTDGSIIGFAVLGRRSTGDRALMPVTHQSEGFKEPYILVRVN